VNPSSLCRWFSRVLLLQTQQFSLFGETLFSRVSSCVSRVAPVFRTVECLYFSQVTSVCKLNAYPMWSSDPHIQPSDPVNQMLLVPAEYISISRLAEQSCVRVSSGYSPNQLVPVQAAWFSSTQ